MGRQMLVPNGVAMVPRRSTAEQKSVVNCIASVDLYLAVFCLLASEKTITLGGRAC